MGVYIPICMHIHIYMNVLYLYLCALCCVLSVDYVCRIEEEGQKSKQVWGMGGWGRCMGKLAGGQMDS